jgi:phage-related protein
MTRGLTTEQTAEVAKSELKTRLLLTLELSDGDLNIIANDTVQQFDINGVTYNSWALTRGQVQSSQGNSVKTCNVTISDINKTIAAKVANAVSNVLNCPATLSEVIFDGFPQDWSAETEYILTDKVSQIVKNSYIYECTTAGTSGTTEPTFPTTIGNTVNDGTCVWTCRTPILDDPVEIISGKICDIKLDEKVFNFNISHDLGNYSTVSPRMTYDVSCPWTFKDSYCGYSGAETTCKKTVYDCKMNKSNIENFGGFPNIPKNWN